jgi:uncharacterized membrane protein
LTGAAVSTLFGFIHLLSLSAWVGGLLLLFLIVNPAICQVLSDDLAHVVSQRLQAAFSSLAVACGLGALASLMALAAFRGQDAWLGVRVALLAAMLALTLYGTWVLQPRIAKILHARANFDPRGDAHPQNRALLRLQKQAWQTDGTVLLLGLITLWLSVGGPKL